MDQCNGITCPERLPEVIEAEPAASEDDKITVQASFKPVAQLVAIMHTLVVVLEY